MRCAHERTKRSPPESPDALPASRFDHGRHPDAVVFVLSNARGMGNIIGALVKTWAKGKFAYLREIIQSYS